MTDDLPVCCQVRFGQQLPKQHAISHVLDDCVIAGVVFKADAVPHFPAQLLPQFFRHPFSYAHGCYPSGLSATYSAYLGVTLLMQILRNLRA